MARALVNRSIESELYVPELLLEFDVYDRYGERYCKGNIRVNWTPEMVHNLQAYHEIDVEGEVTDLLSNEIRSEIGRQILHDIINRINGRINGR